MPDIRPIDAAAHADTGFAPSPDYLHSRALDRVPLLIAEVPTALMLYPLGVSEGPEGLHLVAVLGARAGQNDCLGDGGRWRTGYVPSQLRAWPFAMVAQAEGTQGLGIDLDSGLWRENPDPARGELRFFDADGQPAPVLQRAEAFLRQCAENQAITDAAVQELAQAGVLKPWVFPDAVCAGNPPEGLLRVDQKALHALAPDQLAHLMRANALALAHAQIFSVPRLKILAGLRERDQGGDEGAMRQASAFFDDEGDFSIDLG